MENSSSSVSTDSDHYPYLNNLPDLIYYHILKNLDLDDLWNSRLISKRFYSIIKNYHINELTFSSFIFGNWFTTTRPSRPEYQLPPSKLDLLRYPSNNLLDLKYLKIGKNDNHRLRLNGLNKFTKLQILEIKWTNLDSNHPLIKLPDLKALSIEFSKDDLNVVSGVIYTPNLHSLAISNYLAYNPIDNILKFNHPHSIKYLRLGTYDKIAEIFTNLECLEIRNNFYGLESSDLPKFNNLKSLRFIDDIYFNVLKDIFRSKKDDLEFVLYGVRIREINKIDEYISTKRKSLEFQLNNYGELVDDLWFVRDVIYDELVRLLPDYQTDDLLTKFTNILGIDVKSRVEDGNQLIRFIRGCPNLQQLDISRSSLNQQFYDQLPTIKSLSGFYIHEGKDLNLDFKFLIKMPYLRELYTDQDVLIDSQLNLNDFKRLKWFTFMISNREFRIKKDGRDRYKIRYHKSLGPPDRGCVDHDELVEWSNQLRCKK